MDMMAWVPLGTKACRLVTQGPVTRAWVTDAPEVTRVVWGWLQKAEKAGVLLVAPAAGGWLRAWGGPREGWRGTRAWGSWLTMTALLGMRCAVGGLPALHRARA